MILKLIDFSEEHKNMTIKAGQLVSKANHQAVNSSKKQTNEFIFISMRLVFVHFFEEIEDSKKAFRNYLTFKYNISFVRIDSITLLIKVPTRLSPNCLDRNVK